MPDQWDRSRRGTTGESAWPPATRSTGRPLNQAETLGLSKPTGGIIPRAFEFSKSFEPPPSIRLDPSSS